MSEDSVRTVNTNSIQLRWVEYARFREDFFPPPAQRTMKPYELQLNAIGATA